MSVRFPDVPAVAGVPSVVRPVAQLRTLLSDTGFAVSTGAEVLTSLGSDDVLGANTKLGQISTTMGEALGVASDVYSTGAATYQSIDATVGATNGAIAALASGDVTGAIVGTRNLIQSATDAYRQISDVLTGGAQQPLTGSGAAVNAEIAAVWGLYTPAGALATPADNVVGFDASLEATISSFPVAPSSTDGQTISFGSFNKVQKPYEIRLLMTRGGSAEDRQAFAKALLDAWQATTLYNVVTPETVYLDVNVVGLRRSATADHGATLLAYEVTLQKVRKTATLTFASTKEPTGAGVVNNGSVQTTGSLPAGASGVPI